MFRQFEKESHIFNLIKKKDSFILNFDEFNNPKPFHTEIDLKIPNEINYFIKARDAQLHFFFVQRLFNLCLELGGLPIFSIKDKIIDNKFDIMDKLYNQPINDQYLNIEIENKNKIIGVKDYYRSLPLVPGDVILGVITPGLHYTNLSYITDRAKFIPGWQSLAIDKMFDIISYLRFPTCHVNHPRLLSKLWSGQIKKIITPKTTLEQDLGQVIPEGMRAQIYSNLWGLDNSIFGLCNILKISKYELYHNLYPNIGLIIISSENNYQQVCKSFAYEQNINLIKIGTITDGNIGDKVNIHLY